MGLPGQPSRSCQRAIVSGTDVLATPERPHPRPPPNGTFWSAVYYVRAGEGEGGQLVLHDPRMPALRMHAPALRFIDMGPDVRTEIEPRSGLLVLFPAWLMHSVEPWHGEGSRISVAMNIRAALARR